MTLESRFYAITVIIYRVLVANLLFILASLPLVTVGASLSGMIAVLQDTEDQKYWSVFWRAFRMSFWYSLPPVFFRFMSALFIHQFLGSVGRESLLMWGVRMLFTSFLICYNLNLYVLQAKLHTKHFCQLFRLSFVLTAVTLMKTVLFPIGALLLLYVSLRFLGGIIIVFFCSTLMMIYLKLIDSSVSRLI